MFEGVSLKLSSLKSKEGVDHVMPIFLEEQPITWRLYKHLVYESLKGLENIKILDVGCGSGFWAVLLKKKIKKATVVAIDKNDKALDLCKNNAKSNNVSLIYVHDEFNLSYAARDNNRYDLIVLTPPYHIYPNEISNKIPYFARGGQQGEAFYQQIEACLQLLSTNGLVLFNMMSLGDAYFPDFIYFIKNQRQGISVSFTNIFPPMKTSNFMDELYPEDKFSIYKSLLTKKFPLLYYTSGVITLDSEPEFRVSSFGNHLDIDRSWSDRIKLHKEINKFS